MTTLFPITLICPICESSFTSSSVGSCGYASKRSDFRPNYWGWNPVEFFYHLCPHCGFCASESVYHSKVTNRVFQEEILTLGPLLDYSLEKKLERAFICMEKMNDFRLISLDEFNLANNWIEAFWWASKPDQAAKIGKIVLSYFHKAFEKALIPAKQIFVIQYLMGEIHRRLGHEKEATELFDEVISSTKGSTEFKWIHDLALRQKEHPEENL